MAIQFYLQPTFATAFLRVESIASSATGRAEAGVTADGIVTPLRTQTVVIVQQAFVNIWLVFFYHHMHQPLDTKPFCFSFEIYLHKIEWPNWNDNRLRSDRRNYQLCSRIADCLDKDWPQPYTRWYLNLIWINFLKRIIKKLNWKITNTTTTIVAKDVASRTRNSCHRFRSGRGSCGGLRD